MALAKYFDSDPDFFLEELRADRHLHDYHRLWSDPPSLIWSTQSPKQNLDETLPWLQRFTKENDRHIENYAIMLRPESALNPSNPESKYGPVRAIEGLTESSEPRPYLIGGVGIVHSAVHASPPKKPSSPEIGYMIHNSHWGIGLASRAVRVFLAGYWNVLNPPAPNPDPLMEIIEAHIDPANSASEHIARKLGFEPGEEAGEPFRLATNAELRTMRIWRLKRPTAV